MSSPIWFTIPAAYVISRPLGGSISTVGDVRVAYSEIRGWAIRAESRGDVVIMAVGQGPTAYAALDGPWRVQLDNWASLPDGSGGQGSSGTTRIAAGGFYNSLTTAQLVTFPAADQWVELTNARLQLFPYSTQGTSNVTYDTTNNRLVLGWMPPVPTAGTWLQGMATLTAAATANNQEYAVAFGVNGSVEPTVQARLIRENPNDSETLVLHGHRQAPNGTSLSIFVKNSTGTAALAISSLNFRFFGADNR